MSHISISIESPVKYYDFTDQHGDILATLKFVPSDIDFFDRHKSVYQEFENMQNEIDGIIKAGVKSEEEIFNIKNKYAAKIKEKFDFLFNADTSGFFEIASPFTPMENGKPWALAILENVLKIVESETGKNMEAMKNNSSKYTEKYHAAPGKYPFATK